MTEINIMPCRYKVLEYLIAVTDKINVPFIGYDGNDLVSAGVMDDLGIYYFIPKIKEIFSLSLDQAIVIFFYGIVLVAFALGLAGFLLLYKSLLPRIIAFTALLSLSFLSLRVGDVYIAYSASTIAVFPLFLYFIKQKKLNYMFIFYSFIVGLIISFFQIIRAFSSTGSFLFVSVLVLTRTSLSLSKRLLLLGVIGCGMIIFPLYFKMLYHQYDDFASKHLSSYQKTTDKHIFWHSVYLGFGFLNNDLGIKYDDSVGEKKAISIDPNAIYPSERYEQVMKEQVFNLFKTQKQFVLSTIFAKIGMLFFVLLSSGRYVLDWKNLLTLYLNLLFILGIFLSFLYRKSWKIDLAFLMAILFNALFGILIMPAMSYLLGFVICVALYSVVSINYALEQGLMRDIYNFLYKKQKIQLIGQ